MTIVPLFCFYFLYVSISSLCLSLSLRFDKDSSHGTRDQEARPGVTKARGLHIVGKEGALLSRLVGCSNNDRTHDGLKARGEGYLRISTDTRWVVSSDETLGCRNRNVKSSLDGSPLSDLLVAHLSCILACRLALLLLRHL